MSGQMLLINPRKRRRAAPKRKTTARRRVRRAAPVAYAAPRRRRRRSNPVSVVRRRVMRRRNPVGRVAVRRRRRNPIGLGGGGSLMTMLKGAAVGGAGAIAMDVAMGQIAKFLPASMAKTPGKVGLYDVVKIGATVMLGKFLSKPTRGLSLKMAQGSLVVQARDLIAQFVPTGGMPLGYYSPAAVSQMSQRIGPNGIARYTRPGATPLLGQYTQPGASPLLNGRGRAGSVAAREGYQYT